MGKLSQAAQSRRHNDCPEPLVARAFHQIFDSACKTLFDVILVFRTRREHDSGPVKRVRSVSLVSIPKSIIRNRYLKRLADKFTVRSPGTHVEIIPINQVFFLLGLASISGFRIAQYPLGNHDSVFSECELTIRGCASATTLLAAPRAK